MEQLEQKTSSDYVEELGHVDTKVEFRRHPVPSNQAEDPLNWPLWLKVGVSDVEMFQQFGLANKLIDCDLGPSILARGSMFPRLFLHVYF